MKHVTFQEYEAAKAETLLGVQYKENSTLEGNVVSFQETCKTQDGPTFQHEKMWKPRKTA